MNIITATILSTILVWRRKASNPIKTRIAILLIGGLMIQISSSISGASWISILILMLFMGGIIMMFIILASILPNEKGLKVKNPLVYALIVIFLVIFSRAPITGAIGGSVTKTFLTSGQNFYMIMRLILLFFIGRIRTLSTENTPMRSITCY